MKNGPPTLDFYALAFDDKETIERKQKQYAEDMCAYIKRELNINTSADAASNVSAKSKKRIILSFVLTVVFIAIVVITGILSYQSGKKSVVWKYRQTVYVSTSGKKYHLPNCYHIDTSDIKPMQISEAKKKYSPCKDCDPDRILQK